MANKFDPRNVIHTRPARAAPPALARYSAGVLKDLARKTRFVDPDIAARWSEIAGPELSRICRPGRLTGGGKGGRSFEVIVAHGAAAASVEFASETLKRRLNEFFGPGAIERIVVVRGGGTGGGSAAKPGGLSRFRGG
ncbi:MAG: DUF721 domain-containing protein [Parvularculaceae bacterium]|nr:DUF721 domain-containing protein [Parvularculaceae bacterium]